MGLAFVGTAVTTTAVAGALTISLGLSAAYPVKAALALPLLAALVAPVLDEVPPDGLGVANTVTLARAGLTGLVLGFIGEPRADALAVGLWFFAGLAFFLDAVDGWIARRTGQASPFGARLDMELDGLTVLGLGALLWWLDRTGAWVLAAGALRYVWIAAGAALPWMNAPLPPRKRRAWMCGAQLTTAIFALLPWPHPLVAPALAGAGLAALLYSFGADLRWLIANKASA